MSNHRQIAFLFLTIDDLFFPDLWENYFVDNLEELSIYCHAKNPESIKTKWLKLSVIDNLVHTKWGHFTNAILELLKDAYKNENNQKFMICSESCIPISKFKLFYDFLFNDHIKNSYIDLQNFDDINLKKSKIDHEFVKDIKIKHSGWFCLSRYHVKKLLLSKTSHVYNKIRAGDEHILSSLHPCKYLKNLQITYVNWRDNDIQINHTNNLLKTLYEKKEFENTDKYDDDILSLRIYKSNLGKHPKTFDKLNDNDIDELLNTNAFFARKFDINSNIRNNYDKIINNNTV